MTGKACDGQVPRQCTWGEFLTDGIATAKGLGVQTGWRLEKGVTLVWASQGLRGLHVRQREPPRQALQVLGRGREGGKGPCVVSGFARQEAR